MRWFRGLLDKNRSVAPSVLAPQPQLGEVLSAPRTVAPDPVPRPHFERFSGTRKEAIRLAELFQVQALLDAQLQKSRLLACRPPFLHLATHTYVQITRQLQASTQNAQARAAPGRDNPLALVGIALSGANAGADSQALDGLLTAKEVSGLNLSHTEVAVLSCSHTDVQEDHNGRGALGLQRAFILAGTQSLVMSLWRVPEQPRLQLLEEFYRRILAGEPRALALQSAKLAFRQKNPRSLEWGAFILVGNPGPLPGSLIHKQV
jgi:CHAT domain-containing protein